MREKELFELVVGSKQWVHRRVDKINLTYAGRTCRQMSLDVTVPDKLRIRAKPHAKGIVLPLGFMAKGPQRAFSVQDAAGCRLPVITTDQHADYVVPMLKYVLKRCGVRARPGITDDELTRRLRNLVKSYGSDNQLQADSELLDVLQFGEGGVETKQLSFARQFLATFQSSYLILAVVDSKFCGTRQVFKVEYDEAEIGRRAKIDSSGHKRNQGSVIFTQELTDPGFASSQHVEIFVPDELELGEAWIEWGYPRSKSEPHKNLLQFEPPRDGQRIAHVSSPGIGRYATGGIRFVVSPAREGLQYFAAWSLVVVVVLVLLAWALRLSPPHMILGKWTIPSDAASLFLVAPALFLSWLAKPAENAVAFRALYPLRLLLMWLAFVLLLMAAAAVIPLVDGAWFWLWIFVAAAQAGAVFFWWRYCRYRKYADKINHV